MLRRIAPITRGEFLQMFQTSRPPNGWAPKIAVANSGGPDSTCLLFLLHRLFSDPEMSGKGLPMSTVSLTVNHGLQESSNAMAKQCEKNARSLGVDHITTSITWGEHPFPPRPSETSAFENIARDARYHLLFRAMTQMDVNTLAFGHHADDQVETALMRLARGTMEFGAGGMRPCRRWGMGTNEGGLGWAGYEGMNRWIVRPMLSVSKDRILATCEENELRYVVDHTNFQPEVTLRNAIRHTLAVAEAESHGTHFPTNPEAANLSEEIRDQIEKMKVAAEELKAAHYDISGGAAQLRGAVHALTARVGDINAEVDRHLKRRTVPSPVSTFLLPTHDLNSIQDPSVRTAMVLRIMRYVSFHPWGSVRADGNRRASRLQRIVDFLWSPDPMQAKVQRLVAGSGVLWRLAIIQATHDDGRTTFRMPDSFSSVVLKPGERLGWLASRQNPPKKSLVWAGPQRSHSLEDLDLSDALSHARAEAKANGARGTVQPLEILWDCRFLVRFDVAKMPTILGTSLDMRRSKIVVRATTKWHWPQVDWVRGGTRQALAFIDDPNVNDRDVPKNPVEPSLDGWITIRSVRTLDST